MQLNPPRLMAALAACLLLTAPGAALAYTGPGLGLGAVGVAFGIVGSILLGIFSVLWYPFKRLIRRIRGKGAR
ncbi:hypothetical protein P1X14_00740 [Sphingomonas sp. AOB5]|uniref:hypothetical protein n=1 Tax=Sphingomonas sp. AOB5 TaxID=3034017 RepID=UPI0023F81979|nr:hypothetical protein [Sphingomonas sp. AOB5]MDF7773759.1 hypothetical protein [Sphingomonas sp. AOB5]